MDEREPATTHADLYHRHEVDDSSWEEAEAVTSRTPDTPQRGTDTPAVPNSTFAERAKAANTTTTKAVDSVDAEDKAVSSAAIKGRTRRAKKA